MNALFNEACEEMYLDTRPDAPDINSDFDARWYLERILKAEAELDRAVAYRQQVMDTLTRRVDGLVQAVSNAKTELRFAMERANIQNVKCPDLATAYFTQRAPKVVIADEKALLPDERFTIETIKVSQSKVSDYYKRTHVLPPGCALEESPPSLCIKKAAMATDDLGLKSIFGGGEHE